MTRIPTSLNRRQALAGAGALALATPAMADVPKPDRLGDNELRKLWDQYRTQYRVYRMAEDAVHEARNKFDEHVPFEEQIKCDLRKHPLWQELNLGRLCDKLTKEHLILMPIVTRIRKAKAETIFGVGVKLVAAKYFEEFDFVEAMVDALRQIGIATGTNFLADAGDELIETGNAVGKGDIEISANLHPVQS